MRASHFVSGPTLLFAMLIALLFGSAVGHEIDKALTVPCKPTSTYSCVVE